MQPLDHETFNSRRLAPDTFNPTTFRIRRKNLLLSGGNFRSMIVNVGTVNLLGYRLWLVDFFVAAASSDSHTSMG